jgi:hypothetical protein
MDFEKNMPFVSLKKSKTYIFYEIFLSVNSYFIQALVVLYQALKIVRTALVDGRHRT